MIPPDDPLRLDWERLTAGVVEAPKEVTDWLTPEEIHQFDQALAGRHQVAEVARSSNWDEDAVAEALEEFLVKMMEFIALAAQRRKDANQ